MKFTYLAILTLPSTLIIHIFPPKNNLLQSQSIPDIKKYQKLYGMFCLKQSIDGPTRVTFCSSTIIDHILPSSPDRVSQQGVTVWD